MSISYRGETFSGYNKPKNDRTKTKKFAVLAKSGNRVNWFDMEMQIWLFVNQILKLVNLSELDIVVLQQQTSSLLVIGLVKNGKEKNLVT